MWLSVGNILLWFPCYRKGGKYEESFSNKKNVLKIILTGSEISEVKYQK